jgi:hypothetical protein
MGRSQKARLEIADVFTDLRNQVLSLDPSTMGWSAADSRSVWGVLMETGYPEAIVTLVALVDGTVSLYFSNGGGIIGVGHHEGPRSACEELIASAPEFISHARATTEFPLPGEGRTRFYFLTRGGALTVESSEDALGRERSPLSPLFYKAQEVITQVRLVDERREADDRRS